MDFNQEFKEYTQLKLITSLQLNQQSNTLTIAEIITLENEKFILECHPYEGIKVQEIRLKYKNRNPRVGKCTRTWSSF